MTPFRPAPLRILAAVLLCAALIAPARASLIEVTIHAGPYSSAFGVLAFDYIDQSLTANNTVTLSPITTDTGTEQPPAQVTSGTVVGGPSGPWSFTDGDFF